MIKNIDRDNPFNIQDRQPWMDPIQELLEVHSANPDDFHIRLVTI